MGWLGLFREKDPSETWEEPRQFFPELDLRDNSLCSIPLGADPRRMREFGKPGTKRPFTSEKFVYAQSGVVVEIEHDRIDYFAIALSDDLIDHLKATKAKLTREDGLSMELDDCTTVFELRRFLKSEPITDADDDEIVDTFVSKGRVLEVEAHLDGRVKRINLFERAP
jgi:hypothetical protein